MVEKVEFNEKAKNELKIQSSKNMNMYYRAEGTFTFSLVSLLLCVFLWDTISDPLFFMIFSVVFNFGLMIFFLFRHLRGKKLV